MDKTKLIGNIGQWCGLSMCTLGVVLLIVTQSQIANILISSASVIWGVATKIKYYGSKLIRRRKNDLRLYRSDIDIADRFIF